MSELRICDGKGVHFSFNNGWTLSVQIGGGNYCDNYDYPIGKEREGRLPASTTAEIAYWTADGELVPFENGDTAKGRVPIDEVVQWIVRVQNMPNTALTQPAPPSASPVVDAIAEIRDMVLHGRGPLEGMEIDNDITNAVLGIIDDYTPSARG